MKKLQVIFSDESWAQVESIYNKASEDFDSGSISYSDVINEIVLTSNVDIKTLQSKHIDVRRSLRSFASQENINLDDLIRTLTDLKGKPTKKRSRETAEVKHE
ncbi:MAG: hypothetical protein JNL01_12905 [Bdellovibrionales bacterium]|nr:hypothetical protein [Bdellovibrionales bacterium]